MHFQSTVQHCVTLYTARLETFNFCAIFFHDSPDLTTHTKITLAFGHFLPHT